MDNTFFATMFGLASLQATWRRPSVLATLLGNLVPVVCVLLLGWSAPALLLLYWIENLVFGVFNLLKMLVGALARREPAVLFLGPFFVFHYGLFCLGHGAFVLIFVSGAFETGKMELDHPAALLAEILDRYQGLLFNVLALGGAHLIEFIEWCVRRGWRGGSVGQQMGEPYGRVIVLHLTLIFGMLAMTAIHSTAAAALLLALFKTWFDLKSTSSRLISADRRADDPPATVRAA